VLSHERRVALLRWATTHDATIVEDDYSQFRYASRPLEPLQRLDADGRVVYLGTFSKVLSPSLRLGFAVAPRSIVPALATLRVMQLPRISSSGRSAAATGSAHHQADC
jgi:GntR family transcriptional regulator/MocR family aminotransferase